mgnify:CR=1 FL=1
MSKDLTKKKSAIEKNKFILARTVLASVFVLFVLIGIFSPLTKVNAAADPKQLNFQTAIDEQICLSWDGGLSPGACLVQFSYYLLYVIPAFLLTMAAIFFNILISITLGSTLLKSTFISDAWAVVRDLSNMFFILILLYIAIKVILGMSGSEVKKMIGNVVIMALLINFSMFFTQVIIDSSNILALIFYNKLSPTSQYTTITGEKDIAGGLVQAFNPTASLSPDFFIAAKATQIPDPDDPTKTITKKEDKVPLGMMVGIILVTGLVLLFATYALFVSGLYFVGRLIELFVLIIFSPFAFMSYTIPKFAGIDYIGWDAWFKRLLTVSFMAPIFMFFLYFIFMVVKANIFSASLKSNNPNPGIILMLLQMAIPALVILVLLLQAVKFAKKGSGMFGEMVMKGAKIAGGVALGATVGGAAIAGQRIIGGGGGFFANKLAAKAEKFGTSKLGNKLGFNKLGSGLRDVGTFAQKSSFDIRGAKIGGQTLASATGMKVGEAQKGGWAETKKQQIEKRQKRAEVLEKRGTGAEKKAVDMAEIDLKEKTIPVKLDLTKADKEIDKARIALNDIKGTGDEAGTKEAVENLRDKQDKKDKIRGIDTDTTSGVDPKTGYKIRIKSDPTAGSIAEAEEAVHKAKQVMDEKSGEIVKKYAESISNKTSKSLNFIFRGGYSLAGADEAARKIRMGTKLDSGEKPK